jgi:hypothetical protein
VHALPTIVIQPDEPQSQDAWAYEFTPNIDQNADFYSVLSVGNTGQTSPHNLESFLRFDLSPYSLGGSFVQSASLSLYVAPSESTGFGASPSDAYPLPISAHEVSGSWSEALTWNTRPPKEAVAVGAATLNSASINQWVQLEVTPLVAEWLDAPSSNHGVAVLADQALRNDMGTSVIAILLSSSSDFKPALTIHFDATPGDANLDGKVDVADLGVLAGNWQATGATWQVGDFDNSGTVDVGDLGLLASNWQAGVGGAAFPAEAGQVGLPVVVPEPSCIGLVLPMWLICAACTGQIRCRRSNG